MAMILREQIDHDRAKFLVSLSNDEYAKHVWNEDNDWKGEKEMSKDTYCDLSLDWIKMMIELGGEKDVKYKYSKKMQTDGRMYVDGRFGVPQCKKNLRGFLCQKYYFDYDMRNAHPTILKHILKTYYGCDFEKEYPFLDEYLKNREEFLMDSQLSKTEVLIYLNGDKGTTYKGYNVGALRLCKEFKTIQTRMYDLPEPLQIYGEFKRIDTGKNKHARFMNKLLVIFENKILQEIVKHYKDEGKEVSSLIYDGLHLPKEWGDQTEILNQISQKYGVMWAIKEFDDTIEKSPKFLTFNPDIELPPGYQGNTLAVDYKSVKERMEQSCFFLSKSSSYCIEEKGEYNVYNKNQFQARIAHHMFTSYAKGYQETRRIFGKWEEDPEKRTFYKLDFIPDKKQCPDDVYNTFQGFAFSDYEDVDYQVIPEAIQLFEKQISIIVNHEPKVKDYFIKYFADMFQNPMKIPGVALIMKSPEGWGKDLLTDLIGVLLGNNLMFKTEDMGHIFGKFNSSIKNKMLIHLNELTAKDGFGNKDSLKGKITAETLSIEEKGKDAYDQQNYARWVAATNNLTPIEVNADSRRFVIVSADPVKPERSFHDSFRAT
jgi:hypothetical protein